jgi:hypothetical protein
VHFKATVQAVCLPDFASLQAFLNCPHHFQSFRLRHAQVLTNSSLLFCNPQCQSMGKLESIGLEEEVNL